MKRGKAIEAINSLPDEFHLEQLIERLIVIEKVEEGLKDVADGNVMTAEDVQEFFHKRWA